MSIIAGGDRFRRLRSFGLALIAAAAFYRLFSAAQGGSSDFAVFWRSAQAWWSGLDPYRIPAPEKGFVFKYPPATLPLFLPFAWIPLDASKLIWAALESFSLVYCIRWLMRHGVRRPVALWSAALYWYLWFEHYMYGQSTLLLTALGLWAMDASRRLRPMPAAVIEYVFSLKVFTAYALPGGGSRMLERATLARTALLTLIAHLALASMALRFGRGLGDEFRSLYSGWVSNALSGAADLGPQVIRGAFNHGFTAAILRRVDPQALHPGWDTPLSLLLAISLGAGWWRLSRALQFEEKWAGWLAIAVIAHPLAWQHSFVMGFPLSAYAIQGAMDGKNRMLLALALLGTGLTALWVPQVVNEYAVPLEVWGSKSWGVLLCAIALLLARRIRRKTT